MIEKIKAKFLDWRFWFYSGCTEFCLCMSRKYIGVEGKEKAFEYWIKKAQKYCDKEKFILRQLNT